jgi:hypothetical protein
MTRATIFTQNEVGWCFLEKGDGRVNFTNDTNPFSDADGFESVRNNYRTSGDTGAPALFASAFVKLSDTENRRFTIYRKG